MKKSFTLIELLVVIAIIAILAGLVMPALGHAQARGRTTECINNKKQVMTVLRMYSSDYSSMIPYAVSVKDGSSDVIRPYSWILGGLGSGSYAKEMTSKKTLICNTLNKKELDPNGTNAFGMLDAGFGASSNSWYTADVKKQLGRFVAKALEGSENANTADRTVAYVLEKMKAPSDTILLADSFTVTSSDQENGYWSFSPNNNTALNTAVATSADSMKVNGQAPGSNTLIGTVHAGGTTVAYADGRAEALSAQQLKGSSLKVTHHYNDTFDSAIEL